MSNTIAHLAVAQKIYKKIQNNINNADAYYLGAVAPDAIGSKPDCVRNDKKIVHLREDIRDIDWLSESKMAIFDERVEKFISTYINDQTIDSDQRYFNIGYLVHLLTDKWHHKTIRQALLKVANANGVKESDKDFFYMCVNDLEALDNYLLNRYPDINQLFFDLIEKPVNYCLEGYIEKDYIEESMNWWKNQYLSSIQTRTLQYITEEDIDIFINAASDNIITEMKAHSILS